MPSKGRPRLTAEELQARVAAYCDRYGVAPSAHGLPPFPTGRRETRQHRDWMAVYKVYNRLARRRRGQCERCDAPAGAESVFCDQHRAEAAPSAGTVASREDRRALLDAQGGRCPICGKSVDLREAVAHGHGSGPPRAVFHATCHRLVALAEALGPDGLERVRAYVWPDGPRRRPRSKRGS
jgi:hypothetical protein